MARSNAVLQAASHGCPTPSKACSGRAKTPRDVAKTMLEFAKVQPLNSIYSSIQTMQVNHVVTVSRHGFAGEVMRVVMSYYDDLPP